MKAWGLFLILGVMILSFFFYSGEVKGEETALKSFEGLIIYLDDEIIEVKKGKKEVTFYRDIQSASKEEAADDKKDTSKENTAVEEGKVEPALCQTVRIWYKLKEGKKLVRRIKVLRPGYCSP